MGNRIRIPITRAPGEDDPGDSLALALVFCAVVGVLGVMGYGVAWSMGWIS